MMAMRVAHGLSLAGAKYTSALPLVPGTPWQRWSAAKDLRIVYG